MEHALSSFLLAGKYVPGCLSAFNQVTWSRPGRRTRMRIAVYKASLVFSLKHILELLAPPSPRLRCLYNKLSIPDVRSAQNV